MTATESFDCPVSELHHSLRARRRRLVVQAVRREDEATVPVRSLAREIAANEHGIPNSQATGEPYRNAYNALSQTHLPTLASTRIILYDPMRQTVSAGPNLSVAALVIEITRPAITLLYDQQDDQREEGSITD